MIARTKAPRKRIRVRNVTQESINLGTFILQNGGRGSLYPVTVFSCHIVTINNISKRFDSSIKGNIAHTRYVCIPGFIMETEH